jgi:N-acyl-D-amino-acid deacylase
MNNCILIKNGTLVSKDHDSVQSDLLIIGERIDSIAHKIPAKKEWKTIEAAGKIVAPGFLSIHSHDDFYLPLKAHPQLLKSVLFQGVTTSIGGNCGISNYPILKSALNELDSYQGFLHYSKPNYEWESLQEFLDHIEGRIIVNYIPLIGHGTLRVLNNGFTKHLTGEPKENLKDMLRRCLDQGAFGMSTGLMYMPGTFSTTDELVELTTILKDYPNTLYSSHMRGYSDTYIESVREAIEIGERTGVRVQCSHLGPFGVVHGPKIDRVLTLLHQAAGRGVQIGYDSLAYCGGSTTIMALLPPWSYEKGLKTFLDDIRDDSFFKKVIDYLESYVPQWPSWEGSGWTDNFVRSLGWENLFVLSAEKQETVGKNFIQIGEERDIDTHQAFREVLMEEEGSAIMYMAGVGACIDDKGDMSYFDKMIEDPMGIIAVDAIYQSDGRTMPYAYGTFPRIIDRYVNTKKTITLKNAVERFTSQVADIFGLTDRGYLREGAFADLVIFDLSSMKDYPDVFAAEPLLSTGVEYLLVNGQLIIDNRVFQERLPGRVIRNRS